MAIAASLLSASAFAPYLLSDSGNGFLMGFVNQELLSMLGVISTITLAAAGNLHLEINKLEDRTGLEFLATRRAVKASAYSLIGAFAFSGILVVVKPMLGSNDRATAASNSLAIVATLFSLFVLIDLTRTTFRIPA